MHLLGKEFNERGRKCHSCNWVKHKCKIHTSSDSIKQTGPLSRLLAMVLHHVSSNEINLSPQNNLLQWPELWHETTKCSLLLFLRSLLCSCTDQKELKHACCQTFVFIIHCVRRLLDINNGTRARHGSNGRVVIRMLQHRLYSFTEALFTPLISHSLDLTQEKVAKKQSASTLW